MAEELKQIETRIFVAPERVQEFRRMISAEDRPSTINAAQRLFNMGLDEWTRMHPRETTTLTLNIPGGVKA